MTTVLAKVRKRVSRLGTAEGFNLPQVETVRLFNRSRPTWI